MITTTSLGLVNSTMEKYSSSFSVPTTTLALDTQYLDIPS